MSRTLALLLLLAAAVPAHADRLLMARSSQPFPETMLAVQDAIGAHGYTVSRVQRVDIGLTASGYKTDKYRIVFFGRPGEVRRLADKHLELIPYLPLKLTLFAEGDDTIIVSANPMVFAPVADDPETKAILKRWRRDVRAILAQIRSAGGLD
ncbi:MAG TPA: DUF302 domain-containing protein [Gammaproteobacteria bacterium]|nr:DUF302 domain-containing protein [Gammaproteobacteria bacterium]